MKRCRAHPRSRGENQDAGVSGDGHLGSSPLTRGKRQAIERTRVNLRLIPAHAGKTKPTVAVFQRTRAHPRSRGENTSPAGATGISQGSSPLTRGKRPGLGRLLRRPRLIPAHAGKTSKEVIGSPVLRAHPRSRGENALVSAARFAFSRLIPAHAGKTDLHRGRRHLWQAHPRSRGENVGCVHVLDGGRGSSPLTRGKRATLSPVNTHPRLIPAHAGKTAPTCVGGSTTRAHPRSRGENQGCRGHRGGDMGSSPLTRGKLCNKILPCYTLGLIPAHAGKTGSPPRQRSGPRAHPRSRGENPPRGHRTGHDRGSSPLTRGKPSGCIGGM